jgi:hypothetical protein
LRKKANLQLEDRIELHLGTKSSELNQAASAHGATIAAETLAIRFGTQPHEDGAIAEVKIENQPLLISLKKVTV